ncbi:MAG: peroxiredoxin family protein [Chromatiales bacterium]|jgi:peroxiredoxin|nr:peroxiredoxin family protein [Chromatiales bacterium]MDH4029961.1 peroxiredoxin family protein [Chromatiales bacterium]
MQTNRLKSVFVTIYMLVVVVVLLGSVVGLVISDFRLAWAGALMTVLPFMGLYAYSVTSKSLARTSPRLPLVSTLTIAGGLVTIYGYWLSDYSAHLPMVAAIAAVYGFFLFDFWYSSFGRRVNDRLVTGQVIPEFQAKDVDGVQVGPADLRGRPVLFMFYRGNWCPFCMAQVKEITGRYRELSDRGVELVLISPQPTGLTQRVAEMFQVPCRFWVDEGLTASRALGLVHQNGVPAGSLTKTFGEDTVLPTVIIVNREGRIIFTDQTDNYRVRPDPGLFLKALHSHGI